MARGPGRFVRKGEGPRRFPTAMSKGSTALLVVGILVILLAVVSMAFDFLGRGDTPGLDP